jgi:hypothetical protein
MIANDERAQKQQAMREVFEELSLAFAFCTATQMARNSAAIARQTRVDHSRIILINKF